MHSVVIQKIQSAGLDPDTVSGLSEVFDPNSLYGKPFQGLETQYLQHGKQDLDHLLIHIYPTILSTHPPKEPDTIIFGSELKMKGTGVKRCCIEVQHEMKYIPILISLQRLLQNRTIWTEVHCIDTGSSISCTEILLFSSN